jgi:hypothetical protein
MPILFGSFLPRSSQVVNWLWTKVFHSTLLLGLYKAIKYYVCCNEHGEVRFRELQIPIGLEEILRLIKLQPIAFPNFP